MKTNKLNVETKGKELIMSRIFDAPRELVFEAYSNCEHLKNWWGPKEWPMDECTLEFREGGEWHYCLRGPNEGDESWGLAIYQEINEPEKIKYQDYFSDKDGNINDEMPGMLITVKLIDQDGKTRLESTTSFDTVEALEKIVEMGVAEGFNSSLDRLEEHLKVVHK